MGKIENFRITFDNPSGAYYAGQLVTGKVFIHLKEEIKIKGVFLHLEGKAAVSWSESESYYNHQNNRNETRTVTRSDKQVYFDMKYPLQGTERLNKIGPGQFLYPFSLAIPLNLPSSFEARHGHIRYTCSSNISRPWRFDPKCKAAITVLEVVDLNTIPGAASSASQESQKKTGCCLCRTGTISAAVSINKQGYVPGENIYIQADINNTSEEEVRHSSATLFCWITYKAGHHSKRETRNICDIGRGVVRAGSSDQWINHPLKIPPIAPTRLGAVCRLINVEYFLKFSVVPSGAFNSELDFTFPITIGSIPLRTDFSSFASNARAPLYTIPYGSNFGPQLPSVELPQSSTYPLPIPTAPPAYEPPELNQYPDLPPPSYEECVNGKVNIRDEDDEHTSGELSFAPRYMYYNQVNPPMYH